MLDVRIMALPSSVTIAMQEAGVTCQCVTALFPALGTCEARDDIRGNCCEPESPHVLSAVELLDGGRLVARAKEAVRYGYPVTFAIPEGVTLLDPTVYIARADGEAELPIEIGGPQPTLTTTWDEQGYLHSSWTTDRPADSAVAIENTWHDSVACGTRASAIDFSIVGEKVPLVISPILAPSPAPATMTFWWPRSTPRSSSSSATNFF